MVVPHPYENRVNYIVHPRLAWMCAIMLMSPTNFPNKNRTKSRILGKLKETPEIIASILAQQNQHS